MQILLITIRIMTETIDLLDVYLSFLDSLDRFNQPSSYELKTDDILMTYSPTTGILEREIISGKHRFK